MLVRRFESCPLCGVSVQQATSLKVADVSSHPLYKPELPRSIRWLRCTCGHVFTESHRTELGDRVMFSSAMAGQVLDGWSHTEALRGIWAPPVHRVTAILGDRRGAAPRWLDVGFGAGGLLMTADEFGFEAVGVDSRAEPVKRIRALGYEALCTTFEKFESERTFDVVSMADVLEHLPSPRDAIEKARTLLATGGLLYVSCPNSETSTWRQWEKTGGNPYWAEVEHYHNFSRTKLTALLGEHGFDIVEYYVSARYYACMELSARRRD